MIYTSILFIVVLKVKMYSLEVEISRNNLKKFILILLIGAAKNLKLCTEFKFLK